MAEEEEEGEWELGGAYEVEVNGKWLAATLQVRRLATPSRRTSVLQLEKKKKTPLGA